MAKNGDDRFYYVQVNVKDPKLLIILGYPLPDENFFVLRENSTRDDVSREMEFSEKNNFRPLKIVS